MVYGQQEPWQPQDDEYKKVNYRLYHVIPDCVVHEPVVVPQNLLGIYYRQDNQGPDVERKLKPKLDKEG